MFSKGKLDGFSFIHRISTTTERKLSTTCRALIGFVNSKTTYKHNNFGSDLSINVLNDLKPNFSCCAEEGNLSPKISFCTNAIDQNLKTSHYLHERKNFAVADLLCRSFFQ